MHEEHEDAEPENLEQLLAELERAVSEERQSGAPVSLALLLEAVGNRAFGPLLIIAGLITVMPLVGDIPGVPTLMALLVALSAGQLLLRRKRLWLPKWLLRRSLSRYHFLKGLRRLYPLACWTDRLLKPRLTGLTRGAGLQCVALTCLAIALCMPLMELVPFSATGAGAALTAFGLALIARDGLVALIALGVTLATAVLVAQSLW
ncbi:MULTISPECIES: exopolysaccharide biosynthesis protein [Halomonadaceae]|uniref:Exopolysaccharide biosynthesis protein n=1 Tax=Modicisalibacter zincidurans TaxID=1178777 RepID=A0ABP9QY19_9GAMM|nr:MULTISPECIES: exopolysaccharide biosynthesis protein [Halomonas]MCD6009564.1 exopolysaccharide biosynthesis protein [Halomonas sp. IOP_31]MEA3250682.1 exopolysaccharide biosynthesis protein [Pseudomonadota bacterium]